MLRAALELEKHLDFWLDINSPDALQSSNWQPIGLGNRRSEDDVSGIGTNVDDRTSKPAKRALGALVNEGKDGRHEDFTRTRTHDDTIDWVDVECVEAPLVRRNRLAEFGDTVDRRVLIASALTYSGDRRVQNQCGTIDIREALAEIDRTDFGGSGGHRAEDAGAMWSHSWDEPVHESTVR